MGRSWDIAYLDRRWLREAIDDVSGLFHTVCRG
jgi:hypothetical protein